MNLFNVLIALAAIVLVGGFILVQDGEKNTSSSAATSSTFTPLMDRVRYLDYSKGNQARAQQDGKTVLFFAATTWCQTCSALDKEIKARINDIPPDVTILKVDYDNDRDMKVTYAVVLQHTLVVLDKKGEEVTRWVGGNLDFLLRKVNDTRI